MSQNNPLKNNDLPLSFRTTEQTISMVCEAGRAQIRAIHAIRDDLTAWSIGKPTRVRQAVRNLDGWLECCTFDPQYEGIPDGMDMVDVLACTARAVETLRATVARS